MFLTSLAIFSVILGFLPLIYIIYAITRNYNGIVINLLLAAGLILPLLVIVQNIAIPILQRFLQSFILQDHCLIWTSPAVSLMIAR